MKDPTEFKDELIVQSLHQWSSSEPRATSQLDAQSLISAHHAQVKQKHRLVVAASSLVATCVVVVLLGYSSGWLRSMSDSGLESIAENKTMEKSMRENTQADNLEPASTDAELSAMAYRNEVLLNKLEYIQEEIMRVQERRYTRERDAKVSIARHEQFYERALDQWLANN